MVRELASSGIEVSEPRAPRLLCAATDVDGVVSAVDGRVVSAAAALFDGVDAVVNAAGVTTGLLAPSDVLVGANALLPATLAAATPQLARLIHISSAAVQGRQPVLRAAGPLQPFNPYSASKALGEQATQMVSGGRAIVLRPPSVHAPNRRLTRRVVRLASSGVAATIAPGTCATPQVHVRNVAAAVRHLVLTAATPPAVILQPSEGFTTAGFLHVMGGRKPKLLPRAIGTLAAPLLGLACRSPAVAQHARRAEVLLLGQQQEQSWLDRDEFRPAVRAVQWGEMAAGIRAGRARSR
ncbi:MAG: NAD-dependent epimerase/dehydratase family protein [Actinomycetota bacterium]|nr:NAD-dependent epimerase/dehydratase family protein [Actinomycetota bacterium]